jgi:hypothetical protein
MKYYHQILKKMELEIDLFVHKLIFDMMKIMYEDNSVVGSMEFEEDE